VSRRKSERLMNLVIALLVSGHYLTKDRIRQVVEGYHDQGDDAFERMFERDKEELREIGIHIEVGSHDKLFDDEVGYRILRDDFELPELVLEPDEAAVVGLAARVWQHARLASQTSSALVKLKAAGVPVEPEALSLVEPQLAASEPSFEPLWDAVITRTPVRFEYARPGAPAQLRTVEPWGVLSWHGRWYLVGHDRDRDATRMFRVSRVRGAVEAAGPRGSYTVPPDTDLRALAVQLSPVAPVGTATLRVRPGTGWALRRRASAERSGEGDWDVLEVPYAGRWTMAEDIASFGPDVVVDAPPELREAVVLLLQGVVGGAA
jgi:proteasome accessory factor B